jgi:hypothetical protein
MTRPAPSAIIPMTKALAYLATYLTGLLPTSRSLSSNGPRSSTRPSKLPPHCRRPKAKLCATAPEAMTSASMAPPGYSSR